MKRRGLMTCVVISCCVGIAALALGAAAACAATPEAPQMKVQSHTATGVFLHGVLNPGTEAEPPQEGTYEFLYAASPSTCTGESKVRRGLSLGLPSEEVGEEISGLAPHTTYTVCLLHRNLAGEETLSAPETFTTSFEPETPETNAPDAITSSTAMLHGVLNPNSSRESEPGFYEFLYRRSESECEGEGSTGQISVEEHGGTGAKKEEVQATEITGLASGAQYTVCLRAWNTTGQLATGGPVTFTTLAAKPSVSAEAISSIATKSARVSAQIGTGGIAATYAVEYGTSASYGSQTGSVSLSPGTSTVTVELAGLQSNTEYHYRFVATNEDGSDAGADMSFMTYNAELEGALPDDRVYEMVSPLENHNAEVYEPGYELLGSQRPFMAARDGNSVAYIAQPSIGGNGSTGNDLGDEYRAVRGAQGGWTQTNVTPLGSPNNTEYQAFSEDLSAGYVSETTLPPFVASEVPNSPIKNGNETASVLYERRFDESDFRPLFTVMPLRINKGLYFTEEFGSQADQYVNRAEYFGRAIYAGASSDSSHALLEANDDLMEGNEQLEEELRKNVVKEVEEGEEAQRLRSEERGSEAEALERIDTRDELYMSVDGALSLVNILPDGTLSPGASFPMSDDHAISADGSRVYWIAGYFGSPGVIYLRIDGSRTVQVSEGPAKFWAASNDGRYAFYVESGVLWRFDATTEERVQIAGADGGVQGVVGINESGEDGAYVYFVSTEALAGLENAAGQKPVEGEYNLYVREPDPANVGQSRIQFIGTLSQSDGRAENLLGLETGQPASDWSEELGSRTANVSPDGHALTFIAKENLTGRPHPNEGSEEVYVYDARDNALVCASCRPQASEGLFSVSLSLVHRYRWISEDGDHVFFDSLRPLVAQDTNGLRDVYEWERNGSGACREREGCVYMLSNGTSEGPARLVDASASGSDVFFETSQRLSSVDTNENRDLYDARVDGARPVRSPECSGTGCQGAPAPAPLFATPASVTFTGVGNFPQNAAKPTAGTKKKTVQPAARRRLTKALRECRKRYARRARMRALCEAHARKHYQAKRVGTSASWRVK